MENSTFTLKYWLTLIVLNFRMKTLLGRLTESTFAKNIFIVMSGTAIAQMLGFALIPIISRLFSPADFGVVGSFNSVSSTIATGITLQYTQAIMLPKAKSDAFNLFFVSCLFTLIMASIVLLVCLIIPSTLNNIMKTDGIWALALLVITVTISGLNESCQAWCVRVKSFKHTSVSQVIRSLSSNGMQIAFGYLKAGSFGLILSSILADLLAGINLVRVVIRDLGGLRQYIQWKRMTHLIKEYRDFPMYSASMNVINSLSLGLPVLLLAHFYGIAVAGSYAFAMRILSTPMGFVLTALRQVLFQKAAEAHNDGNQLMPLYVKITLGLFTLAFFPCLALFIWAPRLFAWVFGTQWLIAGEFARVLVLWMLVMFCNLPAILFARIIRIQRKMFFFDLALLSSRALVLILGGIYLSALNTIMLISFLGVIMNINVIVVVGYILMRKERKYNQL